MESLNGEFSLEDDLRQSLKLYLVTDSDILKERDFYDCIEKAILGGVTTVQLREKEASGKEFLEKAIKLREITKKHNVNFKKNGRNGKNSYISYT